MAEKGNADAQYYVGRMYLDGSGIVANSQDALKWFLKAAEQGESYSAFEISKMYMLGIGVAKDVDETWNWSIRAAENGHPFSQLNLGTFYRDEQHNSKEALKWLYLAAEQEEGMAFFELARMFRQGIGVERDLAQALVWIFLAKQKNIDTSELETGLKEEMTPAEHEMADRIFMEYVAKLAKRKKR